MKNEEEKLKDQLKEEKHKASFFRVGMITFIALMLLFIYHYGRQQDRAIKAEESSEMYKKGMIEMNHILNAKIKRFNDTFNNYYIVNKNDTKLIGQINLDTTQQFYLSVNPKK